MDTAFGHAAPTPHTSRQTGLQAALERLFNTDNGRSYSILFPTRETTRIRVRPTEGEPFHVDLPTIIRGRLVANVVEFAAVELRDPIGADELDEKYSRNSQPGISGR